MTWQEILKKAGFPQTAILLDFESYFDTDYSLKKMSTVEYVCDPRFEITGLGHQVLDEISGLCGFCPPNEVEGALHAFEVAYGEQELENVTVVGQNNKFDHLILREKFGITPKFTVDLIDIERIWDAQSKHKLEAMAKRWGAPSPKGDTNQFKGFRWADMTPEMRQNLGEYCKNDIKIESFLLQKLLPTVITQPEIELPLANQTLQLYLKPSIGIDLKYGEELKVKMQQEMFDAIDTVEWVLGYAD